jgi:ferredoxin-NADP reductase
LGVRNPAYHVFARELEQAQRTNPAFVVEVFREDTQGLIPLDRLLARHGERSLYFISGPPKMIRGFRDRLLAAGLPSEQVRTDDWE